VYQRAAMQQLSAKVFKLSVELEYLQKLAIFVEKIAKLHH